MDASSVAGRFRLRRGRGRLDSSSSLVDVFRAFSCIDFVITDLFHIWWVKNSTVRNSTVRRSHVDYPRIVRMLCHSVFLFRT